MMKRREGFRPIGRAISGACLLATALSCAGGSSEEARPGSFPEALQLPPFLPHRVVLDLRAPGSPQGTLVFPRPSRILLDGGWSRAENWGTWSTAGRSTFLAVLDETGPLELTFRCLPFEDPAAPPVQTIRVVVNGRDIGEQRLDDGWGEYAMSVPDGALQVGVNKVALVYGYHLSPAELGVSDDTRKLAVGFERIALIPSDRQEDDPSGLELRGRALVARSPGRVVLPFRSAGDSTNLALSVRAGAGRGGGQPRFRLSYGSAAGDTTTDLLDLRQVQDDEGTLFSGEVALPGGPGELGCLVIDLEPVVGGSLEIVVPRLAAGPPDRHATARVAPSDGAGLPDIVVVLLDAARPDHLGSYGYERDTTPNIDRLAAESLVFENAFAESAYTRASVPTMFTGLSFVDHRVQSKDERLAESATTLAERLDEIGYRTVCYSANPNNSAEAGLAQGCDEFQAFWRERDLYVNVDPFRITERTIELLDGAEGDEPLFLMLHYVPPHEPYAPTREFDIFGDRSGPGGIDGTRETLAAINTGELAPTPEQLARIVSLYDGNLRRGDAAVGRVLDRLMKRDRWDNTVVLVVADHGEAFLEHGRMGHSSTAYDEMLRVPFILRLPEGRLPEVDTGALVSLADIVPTLLGLAGLEAGDGLAGIDLLSGRSREGRGIVAHSADGHYAFRTLDWKIIVEPLAGRRELYHVGDDPGETENLVAAQLDRFLCINRMLEQRVNRSRLLAAAPAEELNPEDLEALRSLGYVD